MSRAISSARSITAVAFSVSWYCGELGRIGEHGLGDVRAGAQLAADRPAQIVHSTK